MILCVIVNAAWCFCRRFSLCKQPYRKFVYMFVILAATTCLCSSLCPVLRDEHTSCRVWVWVWVWVWLRVCVCVCVLPWQETAHKKPRLSTAEAGALCLVWRAILHTPWSSRTSVCSNAQEEEDDEQWGVWRASGLVGVPEPPSKKPFGASVLSSWGHREAAVARR